MKFKKFMNTKPDADSAAQKNAKGGQRKGSEPVEINFPASDPDSYMYEMLLSPTFTFSVMKHSMLDDRREMIALKSLTLDAMIAMIDGDTSADGRKSAAFSFKYSAVGRKLFAFERKCAVIDLKLRLINRKLEIVEQKISDPPKRPAGLDGELLMLDFRRWLCDRRLTVIDRVIARTGRKTANP